MKKLMSPWFWFVVTLVITVVLCIFPFRVINERDYAAYDKKVREDGRYILSEPVTMTEIVLQEFIPEKPVIEKLSAVAQASSNETDAHVFATVYDDAMTIVYQETLSFKEINDRGKIEICPENEFEPGRSYYFGINVHFDAVGSLSCAFAETAVSGQKDAGVLYYASNPILYYSLLMEICYEKPLSAVGIILGIFLTVIAGAGLYILGVYASSRKKLLSALILIAGLGVTAFFFYKSCLARIFGGERIDLLVYAFSSLLFMGLVAYFAYVCYREEGKISVFESHISVRAYLQTAMLVLTLWSGIYYENAGIQWRQDRGRNLVILFFGLFVLLTVRSIKKRFIKWTAVYFALTAAAGLIFGIMYSYGEHVLPNNLILIGGFIVWGYLVILTAPRIMKVLELKPVISVFVLVFIVFISMEIWNYGKLWAVMGPLMFIIFYLQSYDTDVIKELVVRFGNSVLIHFGTMVIMCLMMRPFHRYRFTRYPMFFHTVACTGMYLALVLAVCLVKLFMKMVKTRTVIKCCLPEWILFGIVSSYILLTMSRTALFAVAGMVGTLFVGAIIVYRPGPVQYVKGLGTSILAALLLFPLIYTGIRCIPAMVANPVHVETIEDDISEIRVYEEPDSHYYNDFYNTITYMGERLGINIHLPASLTGRYWEETKGPVLPGDTLFVRSSVDVASLAGLFNFDISGADTTENGTIDVDASNGRLDIFKDYLMHIRFVGHPEMGIDNDHTMLNAHAHNSYLQTAFDFGIIAGLALLILNLVTIIICVIRIIKNIDRSEAIYLTLLVTVSFLISGLTEYISNYNIPLCFGMFFVLLTVIRKPLSSKQHEV